jgi:hypothetical protein
VDSSNDNARADRSNLLFTAMMADNTPREYLSYRAYSDDVTKPVDPAKKTFAVRVADVKEHLYNATPCSVGHSDDPAKKDCFAQVMRLAYLNQESDQGSLGLRRGLPCLNQRQLDLILNENQLEVHPLNCAKMNAKPYPYFDGGVMRMQVPGKFSFFGSRNNNFSNRDQKGLLCVRGATAAGGVETCGADGTVGTLGVGTLGVLQDVNLALSTKAQQEQTRQDLARAACLDSANAKTPGVANDQGATSCLTPKSGTRGDAVVGNSFVVEQAVGDHRGVSRALRLSHHFQPIRWLVVRCLLSVSSRVAVPLFRVFPPSRKGLLLFFMKERSLAVGPWSTFFSPLCFFSICTLYCGLRASSCKQ